MNGVQALPQQPGHQVGVVDEVVEVQGGGGVARLRRLLQPGQGLVQGRAVCRVEHHWGAKGDAAPTYKVNLSTDFVAYNRRCKSTTLYPPPSAPPPPISPMLPPIVACYAIRYLIVLLDSQLQMLAPCTLLCRATFRRPLIHRSQHVGDSRIQASPGTHSANNMPLFLFQNCSQRGLFERGGGCEKTSPGGGVKYRPQTAGWWTWTPAGAA